MKIYMKVKKDIAYNAPYPWNKYIKEQVRETVSKASSFMFDEKFYPMFYQEDTHCHFITAANGERHFLDFFLKYELCFVWEYDDYDNDDNYFEVASAADVYLDEEDNVKPSKEYVYLGSYKDGQSEPLTLPGLVLDPKKHGEILADCMFTDEFSDRQQRRVFEAKL